MSQDDVERLRDGYAAFNSRDWDRVVELFAPGFEAHDRPDAPGASHYRDPWVVLRQVGDQFDDYRQEPLEFVDGGDWILVVLRQSGRGRVSGVPVEEELVHLWRIREGKAVSLQAFSTREEALAAASGPAQAG